MRRADLIDAVRHIMAQAGYAVSERCDLRPVSFDLVARRDRDLLILKVLHNVDALDQAVASEIKLLCRFLEARPLLVGVRAGTGELEDGVVYNRHEIPIITPATLYDSVLEAQPPLVFAAPGGFYVHLDKDALREARRGLGLSLGAMAQVVGVSRRAIQMYEQGMSARIEAAMRLEEALGADLIRPTDPREIFDASAFRAAKESEKVDPAEAVIRRILEGLGYKVRSTRRSPFNALSTQEEDTFLTGIGEESPQLKRRARIVHSVSRVTERPGFFVVERTTKTEIQGMPVVTRKELQDLDDPQKILDLILERTKE